MTKTSRELDGLVAEKVMGWTNITNMGKFSDGPYDPAGQPPDYDDPESPQGLLSVPHYSTEIKSAWEIAEKLRLAVIPMGERGSLWSVVPGACVAEGNYYDAIIAVEAAASIAICMAALHVVGYSGCD